MKKPFHEYCLEISKRATPEFIAESHTLVPELAKRLQRAITVLRIQQTGVCMEIADELEAPLQLADSQESDKGLSAKHESEKEE